MDVQHPRASYPNDFFNCLPADGEVYFFDRCLETSGYLQLDFQDYAVWRQDAITIRGNTYLLPRKTAYYGEAHGEYTYSGIRNIPVSWNHIHALDQMRRKISELYPRVSPNYFTNCLINRYRNGNDSIAQHADNEPELGENPVIACVSFGAARKFIMVHNETKDKVQFRLGHNQLLIMAGETQKHWKHYIPKEKEIENERMSFTFRKILRQHERS